MNNLILRGLNSISFKIRFLAALVIFTFPFNLMAGLTKGNETTALKSTSLGNTTYTFSHTQDAGDDGHLFLICAMSNTQSFSGATYNGVAMTEVRQENVTGNSTRWVIYELDDPATGANDIVVTFSNAQWNPQSFVAVSFTECAGAGNDSYTTYGGSPVTSTFTVTENSMVFQAGLSGNTTSNTCEIPQGSSRTLIMEHNASSAYHWAAVSPTLSAGSTTFENNANTNVALINVEVLEAASSTRRVIIIN